MHKTRSILATMAILLSTATLSLAGPAPVGPMPSDWSPSFNTVETDPYNNKGNRLFYTMHEAAGRDAIVPKVVYPYLPSGNILNNAFQKDARDAPDIGAVEAIILYLAQAFKGTANSGETGKWLWKLTILFCTVGMLLSGFLIFKAVSQGQKPPGEALVSFLVKCCVTVIMVSVVTPNIPPMLIGISNTITKTIDNWFYETAGDNKGLISAIYHTKMAAGTGAAKLVSDTLTDMLKSYVTGLDPAISQKAQKALNEALDDPNLRKAIGEDYKATADNDIAELVNELKTEGKNANDINNSISASASQLPDMVIGAFQKAAEKYFKQNSSNQADQAILGAIAAAPRSIDLTTMMRPPKVVTSYAYIAFAFLSIGIWGMGFAALVWTILYSMPEEFQFGGILFTGFKGCAGILLSIVLISVYMSAGINWADRKSEDFIVKEAPGFIEGLKQKAAKAAEFVGSIPDKWNSAKEFMQSPGSAVGRVMGWFTGASLEQFMVGILVLTTPAQAALMMKGANGIAEHAKQALNANGAASQSISGITGSQGGGSQPSLSGGGSMSSVYGGSAVDKSALMAPRQKGGWETAQPWGHRR